MQAEAGDQTAFLRYEKAVHGQESLHIVEPFRVLITAAQRYAAMIGTSRYPLVRRGGQKHITGSEFSSASSTEQAVSATVQGQ
jgi:hypothetical protein